MDIKPNIMYSHIRKILLLAMTASLSSCMERYPFVEQMTGIIDETFTRTSFEEGDGHLKTNS